MREAELLLYESIQQGIMKLEIIKKIIMAMIVCLSFSLLGCNTSAIYMDSAFNPPVDWGTHYVKPGENIGTIAWRYGRDYRELASANEIRPPYTIAIGQRIRLDLKGDPNAYADYTGAVDDVAYASVPGDRESATADVVYEKRPNKYSISDTLTGRSVNGLVWQWPTSGRIVSNFNIGRISNKGIDIAGNEGDPVYAAADGRVVYSGSGVVGYGNLIILDHGPGLLSAYAHNSSIYVRIGDAVRRGEVISSMGRVGTSEVKLHFEIRKGGKPVDPTNFLPSS